MREVIETFDGENRFLSNFYPSEISIGGIVYPSVEHYFQASKANSIEEHFHISSLTNPHDAKAAGRAIDLRPDWEEIKFGVMLTGVTLKFFQNPWLKTKLVATGDARLVEGNTWGDQIWGATWDPKRKTWVGENHLGEILMDVRELITEWR